MTARRAVPSGPQTAGDTSASIDLAEVVATADAPDGRTVRLAALCMLGAAAGIALR